MQDVTSIDLAGNALADMISAHPQYFLVPSVIASIDSALLWKINGPFPVAAYNCVNAIKRNELDSEDGYGASEAAFGILQAIYKMAWRIVSDQVVLEVMLGERFGRISGLTFLGEHDWGTKICCLLESDRGHRFLYKSRSSAVELWFAESLTFVVNEESTKIKTASGVDRGGYSWHSYLGRFGRRLSELTWNDCVPSIAWMIACRLTDCHDENVANFDDKPALLDLEMALQPFKSAIRPPKVTHCCHFWHHRWSLNCLELPLDASTLDEIGIRLHQTDRQQRERMLTAISLAQNFDCRIVLLPTSLYQRIIDECAKLDMVGEGRTKNEFISISLQAFRHVRGLPNSVAIEAVEASALRKRMIPRFWSKTRSRVLGSEEHIMFADFFDKSGVEAAREQIEFSLRV